MISKIPTISQFIFKFKRISAIVLAGAVTASTVSIYSPLARADADKGADSFDSNCAECHSVANPPRNKKGPSLFGVVDRPAGKIDGFEYSDGLKASGITWSRDKIDAYITAPKSVIPGGKMKFDGLSDAAERKDLIDFLASKK